MIDMCANCASDGSQIICYAYHWRLSRTFWARHRVLRMAAGTLGIGSLMAAEKTQSPLAPETG